MFSHPHTLGEHVQNGDHSDAHVSTFSHSSKEVNVRHTTDMSSQSGESRSNHLISSLQDISTEGSPKKDKKKKKGLRTPSFLKKKKEKKKVEA